MPWVTKGKEIIKEDTGKVVGHGKTAASAKASVRARYAAAAGENMGKMLKKGKK